MINLVIQIPDYLVVSSKYGTRPLPLFLFVLEIHASEYIVNQLFLLSTKLDNLSGALIIIHLWNIDLWGDLDNSLQKKITLNDGITLPRLLEPYNFCTF